MIKIISGVYGYRNEKGAYVPKTSKSGPFSLSKAEEKRLVDRKVAVYVSEAEKQNTDNPENDSGKPKYNVKTKADKLGKMMKAVGLLPRAGMSRAEMVAALDKYYEQKEAENADDSTDDADDDSDDGNDSSLDDDNGSEDNNGGLPDLNTENVVT